MVHGVAHDAQHVAQCHAPTHHVRDTGHIVR
jgi:hypothetical protein